MLGVFWSEDAPFLVSRLLAWRPNFGCAPGSEDRGGSLGRFVMCLSFFFGRIEVRQTSPFHSYLRRLAFPFSARESWTRTRDDGRLRHYRLNAVALAFPQNRDDEPECGGFFNDRPLKSEGISVPIRGVRRVYDVIASVSSICVLTITRATYQWDLMCRLVRLFLIYYGLRLLSATPRPVRLSTTREMNQMTRALATISCTRGQVYQRYVSVRRQHRARHSSPLIPNRSPRHPRADETLLRPPDRVLPMHEPSNIEESLAHPACVLTTTQRHSPTTSALLRSGTKGSNAIRSSECQISSGNSRDGGLFHKPDVKARTSLAKGGWRFERERRLLHIPR